MSENVNRWVPWLRRMLLLEIQLRGSIERHRAWMPDHVRPRYDALIRLSETRSNALVTALAVRGQKPGTLSAATVRFVGRTLGTLTSFGGKKRIAAMDLDGVRRLESGYFEASSDRPPVDISCALCGFIAPLEAERAGLIEDVRPLFE
jgi:hypothetical protein